YFCYPVNRSKINKSLVLKRLATVAGQKLKATRKIGQGSCNYNTRYARTSSIAVDRLTRGILSNTKECNQKGQNKGKGVRNVLRSQLGTRQKGSLSETQQSKDNDCDLRVDLNHGL
ncbi:hypothetical protein Q9L58_006782, partial [Maublancomyces gigas]